MLYKIPEDPLKITFLRVIPWEEAQGLMDRQPRTAAKGFN